MDNLNKQNHFTEEWKKEYPLASEAFCKWVDKYKEKVKWDELFNGVVDNLPSIAPKFHDLPVDLQVGILGRFFWELDNGCWLNGCYTTGAQLLSDLRWNWHHAEQLLVLKGLVIPIREPKYADCVCKAHNVKGCELCFGKRI